MKMYQRLIAYKKQHKTTSVPSRLKEDRKLGLWVVSQRQHYKKKYLSIERIKYLESIGFVWKMRDHVPWIEMYNQLVAYKQCYQSTVVSQNSRKEPRLGKWVCRQRVNFNN